MATEAVALKYARALFDEAREQGNLDRVSKDMDSLLALEAADPAFISFLKSPEVLAGHKVQFVKDVFGPRLAPLVVNFILLVGEKARTGLLGRMCRDFRRLTEEHRGLLRARVVTAVPLGSDEEARLRSELDRITGKSTILEKRVDPSILGGVIVHLGTKIIDRSLERGLKDLSHDLLQVELN